MTFKLVSTKISSSRRSARSCRQCPRRIHPSARSPRRHRGPTAQPSGTTQVLYGVWGSGRKDVFAVGTGGTILHYDGTSWTVQPSGTPQVLYGVWGSRG